MCTPRFKDVNFSFEYNPLVPSFEPGDYFFAFKYYSRQVGWGIETVGKYFTYAAPSSSKYVNDGWPTPFVKESILSKPYRVTISKPWNIAKIHLLPEKPLSPFLNIGYYMATDSWIKIDEKSSNVVTNIIQFS